MAPSPISTAMQRLDEWEEYFAPWFQQVRLLGEISITTPDVEEIAQDLRTAGAVRIRQPRWPHTLAVYMAAVAARNDERSYWPALLTSLNLRRQPNVQNELGGLFMDVLRRYDLPRFQQVGGYHFVTPIRLHGGIPAYSLPDFFEEVVCPAVTKPDYAGLTPAELIPLFLERSAVHYFVDSPVRYFLKYGGEPAETFFARCLDMARIWESDHALPAAADLELPRYVVRAFQEFAEGQLKTARGRRLRAPFLRLAPSFGDALFAVELPEQPVDIEQAGWTYYWRIYADVEADGGQRSGNEFSGEEIGERVRVRRSAYDLITVGRALPLFLPPCRLRIQFEATPPGAEPQLLGRWRLELGPTREQQFIAFRPTDGRPLSADQALPADVLWLFYPRHLRIEFGGQAHRIQSFPELAGDWADWQIEEWDLRKTRSLWLVDDDGTRLSLPFAVRQAYAEARLLGEQAVSGQAEPDGTPLYMGVPPRLWIPRLTGDSAAAEMKDWQITLTSRWATVPQIEQPIEERVSHWEGDVIADAEGFTLPLSVILGDDALGVFTLTIRGPRNFRQEMRLRLWSSFVVDGLAPYYVPGARGAEPVTFQILVPETQRVSVPFGETATVVTSTDIDGLFQVTVAADTIEARLELIAPRGRADPVRLPLRLAVPRLRWLLHFDNSHGDWNTTPVELPAAKLIQSSKRILVLDWTGVEVMPDVAVALLDATQDPPEVLQEERLSPFIGSDRRNVLDLSRFYDTIQFQGDRPVLTLGLMLSSDVARPFVPLVQLKRSLEIGAVVLAWDAWGKTALHWDSPHRLRNRRVRIWSAWRPWEPAREFIIPDDASPSPVADGPGSGMMILPERLPKGWYYVALRTAHLWEESRVPRFPTQDAVLSRDGDCELRAVELKEALDSGAVEPFDTWFELACIFNEIGDVVERDRMIGRLREHLSQGEPHQVVALKEWLQQNDPNAAKVVRMLMYRPDLLYQLFQNNSGASVRTAYLDDFTASRLINPDAAKLVLDHEIEPNLVMHALQVLIARDLPRAVDYLVQQMNRGAFSDPDAIALLKPHADASFALLRSYPHTPARGRLLRQLAPMNSTDVLIERGQWLWCEAGWGRIEQIVDSRGADACFFVDDPPEKLIVLLRADVEGEPVEVDLSARKIRFLNAEAVYRCTKDGCPGFASIHQHLVIEKHNRAAHNGLGPAFTTAAPQISYRKPLRFSKQAPVDPFS